MGDGALGRWGREGAIAGAILGEMGGLGTVGEAHKTAPRNKSNNMPLSFPDPEIP
jgi:hypothetical protein